MAPKTGKVFASLSSVSMPTNSTAFHNLENKNHFGDLREKAAFKAQASKQEIKTWKVLRSALALLEQNIMVSAPVPIPPVIRAPFAANGDSFYMRPLRKCLDSAQTHRAEKFHRMEPLGCSPLAGLQTKETREVIRSAGVPRRRSSPERASKWTCKISFLNWTFDFKT